MLGLDGPGTAARVVFSEADGLSGLVADPGPRHVLLEPELIIRGMP